MKKNLVINSEKKIIDDFRIICFETYRKEKILNMFSYSDFFKVAIQKLLLDAQQKYGVILKADKNQLDFFSKRKQTNPITKRFYKKEELDTLSFRLSLEELQNFYNLLNTVYYFEYEKIYSSFSASVFFQLVIKDIKGLKFSKFDFEIYKIQQETTKLNRKITIGKIITN